jgi:predicted ribosomally synthesized peptide with SipW-like signal peptide
MRRILFPILVIGLAAGLFTLGSGAFFSDTETDTGNTITAGTLDLKLLDGADAALGAHHCDASNVQPGQDLTFTTSGATCITHFKNNGSLVADLWAQVKVNSYACTDTANGGAGGTSQYCDVNADLVGGDFTISSYTGPAAFGITAGTSTIADLVSAGCVKITDNIAAAATTSLTFDLTVKTDLAASPDNLAQGDAIKITIIGQLVQDGQPGTCS